MKVVGINGSHREGNTKILVEKALEVCAKAGFETAFVSLHNIGVKYCVDCDHCRRHDRCVITDDGVNGILDKLVEADAIVVGSPTYFGSVSGKLKALFDRTLPLRRNNMKLSGKIGGALAVGGSRNGGQEYVVQAIHSWMLIHEMSVVGDKGTAHFGGIGVGRKPGDVLEDDVGVETAVNLGKRIVDALNRLEVDG